MDLKLNAPELTAEVKFALGTPTTDRDVELLETCFRLVD